MNDCVQPVKEETHVRRQGEGSLIENVFVFGQYPLLQKWKVCRPHEVRNDTTSCYNFSIENKTTPKTIDTFSEIYLFYNQINQ